MKISIITINLNNLNGLRATIDSVKQQSFHDYEWIVIDGGSQDGSRQLIEANKENFAYWVSETDLGIYNAMNKGLQHASGEYCLFLNSGDWLVSADSLLEITPYLTGDIFAARSLSHNGKCITGESRYISNDDFSLSTIARASLPHQSTFIKTSLLHKVGGYDESYRLLADWAFFMKMAINGDAQFIFSDTFMTIYNTNGLSATNKNLFMEEKKRVMDIIPDIFRQDIPLALSLQDVQTSSFGRICYRLLYRLCQIFKRLFK